MKMMFHISEILSDHLIQSALSDLLSGAEVILDDIRFDSSKKAVDIQLTRYPVTERKSFLGFRRRIRDSKGIRSKIAISNVEKSETHLADTCRGISKITLLFGIGFRDQTIFFGSVQEASGKHCYSARYWGPDLVLEVRDGIHDA